MKRKFFEYTRPKKRRYPTEYDYDNTGKRMRENNVYNPDNEAQFYDYGGKPYNPDITNWNSDADITANWHSPIIWNFPHGPDYETKKRNYYRGFQVERVPEEVRQPNERQYVVRQPVETFTPANPVENMTITRIENGVPKVNANKVTIETKKKGSTKLYKPKDSRRLDMMNEKIKQESVKATTDDFAIDYRKPSESKMNQKLYQRLMDTNTRDKVRYIVRNIDKVPDIDQKIASEMLPYMLDVDEFARNMGNVATTLRQDQANYQFFKTPVTNFSNKVGRIQNKLKEKTINQGEAMMGILTGMMDYMNDINKEMISNTNRNVTKMKTNVREAREEAKASGENIKEEMKNQMELMIDGLRNSMGYEKGNMGNINWQLGKIYTTMLKTMGIDLNQDYQTIARGFNAVVNNIIDSNEQVLQPRIREIHTRIEEFNPNPIYERMSQLEKENEKRQTKEQQLSQQESDILKQLDDMKNKQNKTEEKVNTISTEVDEIKIKQSDAKSSIDKMLDDINTLFAKTRMNQQELEKYKGYLKNIGSQKFIDYLLNKPNVGIKNDEGFFNTLLFLGELDNKGAVRVKDKLFGYLKTINDEYNNTMLKSFNDLLNSKTEEQNAKFGLLKAKIASLNKKVKNNAQTFNNMLNRDLAKQWNKMDKRVQHLISVNVSDINKRLEEGKIVNDAMEKLAQMDINFKNFVSTQQGINNNSAANITALQQMYDKFDNFYTQVGLSMLNNSNGLNNLLGKLDLIDKTIAMAKDLNQTVSEVDLQSMAQKIDELNNTYLQHEQRLSDFEQTPPWSGKTLTAIIQGADSFNNNIKMQIYNFFTSDPVGINLFNSRVAGSLLHGQDMMHADPEPFDKLREFIMNKQAEEMQSNEKPTGTTLKDIKNVFWREVLNGVDLKSDIQFRNRNDIDKMSRHWTDAERKFVDRASNAYNTIRQEYIRQLKSSGIRLMKSAEEIVDKIPHLKALTYAPYYAELHHRNQFNEEMNLIDMINKIRIGQYLREDKTNNWYKNLENDPMVRVLNDNVIRLNGTPQYVPVVEKIKESFNSPNDLLAHIINNYQIPEDWQRTPERVRNWIAGHHAVMGNMHPDRMAFYGNLQFPIVVRLGNELNDIPDYYRFGNFDRRNPNVKMITWQELFGNEVVPLGPREIAMNEIHENVNNNGNQYIGDKARQFAGELPRNSGNMKVGNVIITNQPIDKIRSRAMEVTTQEFEAAASEVAIQMQKNTPRVYTGKRGRPKDNYDYYNQVYKLPPKQEFIASRQNEDIDEKLKNMKPVNSEHVKAMFDKWRINKRVKEHVNQIEKYPFNFK